jgi:hypothetical protein
MTDDELLRNVLIKSRQLGTPTEMLEAVVCCPNCGHDGSEHEDGDGICQGIVTVNGEYVGRVCGCTRGRGEDD